MQTIATQLHAMTELLLALVGPPPAPAPVDPAAPCVHPRRTPLGTLAAPRRWWCEDCSTFFEE